MNRLAPAAEGIPRSHSRPWSPRTADAALVYLGLYIALDWLSYVQPVLKLGITPWNPQAGLTLAFLLVYGPRWASVTAVAALLSEIFVRQSSVLSPLVLGASVWIAVCYGTLALLLRRWHLDERIRTLGAGARLAGASVGATLVVAAGYGALFVVAGELPADHALEALPRLWIGDLTGILTLTPLLIWAAEWRGGVRITARHGWEMAAQLSALLLTLWIIFGLLAMDQLRFFYPLFVPVIWVALRWGVPGALLAALTIQIGLIVAAQDQSRMPPLIDLQFLMLTLSLTALLLGAVVTERADVLRRVAMREAEQGALLAMAPDAVLAIDTDGYVRMANPAAVRLFGEAAGAQAARLSQLLPGLQLQAHEGRATLEGRRADGVAFPAEVAWAQLDAPANEGWLVTVRDAADRHRAEAQLRERDTALARAMRFAVAGELASALAHELNQPITALVSYLRAAEILAAPFGAAEERLTGTLGKAAREAIRASEVLRRLRDLYRGGALKCESIDLPALCEAVSQAFQDRLRNAGASLILRLDASLPALHADVTQLEIVLHNLLSNAIDAVAHVERPWRRIELHGEVSQDCVLLRIEDSGPGIASEVAQKLFEPFVTSKFDGMGLGLAISRSLVRARGGELSYERSRRLRGACFIVRLPLKPRVDEAQ